MRNVLLFSMFVYSCGQSPEKLSSSPNSVVPSTNGEGSYYGINVPLTSHATNCVQMRKMRDFRGNDGYTYTEFTYNLYAENCPFWRGVELKGPKVPVFYNGVKVKDAIFEAPHMTNTLVLRIEQGGKRLLFTVGKQIPHIFAVWPIQLCTEEFSDACDVVMDGNTIVRINLKEPQK